MKALALFSGGLDSILAVKLMEAQGVDVQGLFFETPFFSSAKAGTSAASIKLPLKVVDLTEPHLEVVKKPKHGYGENMNPCVDCHALMLRKAGDMLQEEEASFIVTGEVLGQRPMSQNKKALFIVAAESGYGNLILRPLSAKRLPITVPEEKGWVRREKLLGLSGRSRKPQMELAKTFGITEYPSPGGGCLLTDHVFSKRLKDLFSSRPSPALRDVELLKIGRHFRLGPHTKLVVGRNKRENDLLASFSEHTDLILTTMSVPGPTALLIGDPSPEMETLATLITVSYSDAKGGESTEVKLLEGGRERYRMGRRTDKKPFKAYMI
jgi:tRNA U34 2-thiouridine synthase MnmA/TrmU